MVDSTDTPEAGSSRSPGAGGFVGPSAFEWLCLPCGLWLLMHYAWLMDDAFVYFRYVDNLLFAGRGLVFNAGEYVEGYSSPLWTLLLIALRSTGLDYWVLVQGVGVVSFTAAWYLLVLVNRRMSPSGPAVLNVPLCYLSFNYAVSCYFTSGLETPLVQVSAVLYALFILQPRCRWLAVAIGFTPILRHELIVPFALCGAWAWVRERRVPWVLGVSGGAALGGWLLFRIYYYADLFPNTFYLKDTVDVLQGLRYVHDTARAYWLYPFVAICLLVGFVVLSSDRRAATGGRIEAPDEESPRGLVAESNVGAGTEEGLRGPARLMMLLLALSVTAYVVKIGGDPRHYRYLAFPFCLAVCSAGGLFEQLVRVLWIKPFAGATFGVGVVLAIVSGSLYPRQLHHHPIFTRKAGEDFQAAHEMVDKINDAWMHRYNPTLAQESWSRGEDVEYREAYLRCAADQGRHTSVSNGAWCVFLYKRPDVRVVQTLGLTDPILARVNVKPDRPGHKLGLVPLASDLEKLIRAADNDPKIGMFDALVSQGRAPKWVADNLETIRVIEKKMLNRHGFGENLALALSFPERIDPGDRIDRWKAQRRRGRQTNR